MIVAIIARPKHLEIDRVKFVAAGRYVPVGTDYELLHDDGRKELSSEQECESLLPLVDRVEFSATEKTSWRRRQESFEPRYLGSPSCRKREG